MIFWSEILGVMDMFVVFDSWCVWKLFLSRGGTGMLISVGYSIVLFWIDDSGMKWFCCVVYVNRVVKKCVLLFFGITADLFRRTFFCGNYFVLKVE